MFLLIYITHPDEATAHSISNHLLEHRLIACANIYPMKSAYWWQGKVANENEWVSIIKTQAEHWDVICQQVEAMHPYDVPCITRMEAHANAAYEAWIISETDRG
ncbi:MAG: divalent-cation tolerance protein CutA [Bacteroidota bacterium]